MVAMRMIGWLLSTDQIALLISGTSSAALSSERTTSDIAASSYHDCSGAMYTASGSLAISDACFTSAATPTIVYHGQFGNPPTFMRCPSGFLFPNSSLASDSLITITCG